ncbi:hypothetical protein HPB51_020698 [Rhipicephalus microplus]|uniref:Uncharacterized protein n=1 Tax=Rhipicephalus microplus TaxID=6941 RepID=A0A9J6EVB1_RHIMP|nr:hypothetical protein HPB51_020698 [Rhipicephalus microplus]
MDRGSLAAGGNDHAKLCGLSCAPGKSELLMIQPGKPKKEPPPNVTITIDGIAIKPAQQIRILGRLLQIDGKAQAPVTKMKTSAEQILGIIRRVSNRKRGLKEDDVMRLNKTPGKDDQRPTVRANTIARKLEENPRVMLIVNASLRTKDRAIAEEVAVTLVLVEPSVDTVVTDSKIAYGSFRSGVISSAARAILFKCKPPGSAVELVWVQAHSQIKDFVREEVACQLSLISGLPERSAPLSPTLRTIIRDQVSEVLPPQLVPPVNAPLTYAEAAA